MQVNEVIKAYLDDRINKNTKRAYKNYLKNFLQFLIDNNESDLQIKRSHCHRYKAYLSDRNYAHSTIRWNIICIRNFYHYLVAEGIVKINPWLAYKLPKVHEPVKPKDLERNVVLSLFNHMKDQTDFFILYFLIFHALRRAEVASLKVDYFFLNIEKPYFRLPQKGGSVASHTLNIKVVDRLEKFMNGKSEYLFPGKRNNKHISCQTVYRRLKNMAEKIGMKEIHPHLLRHFAITEVLKRGYDIKQAMQFANHKSITTTNLYDQRRQDHNTCPVLDFEI